MTAAIPVREGLFRETDDGPTLLAGECGECGRIAFPISERCLECGVDGITIRELGSNGVLLCATVVHMGNGRFEPGYSVGYILMPHGVRVFSQTASDGHAPLASGTPMRLELAPLWRHGEDDVLAYRFVPAASKEIKDA